MSLQCDVPLFCFPFLFLGMRMCLDDTVKAAVTGDWVGLVFLVTMLCVFMGVCLSAPRHAGPPFRKPKTEACK